MRYRFTILCAFLVLVVAKVFPQCAGPVTYTVSPAPNQPGNTYAPGQIVTFCVTVTGYNQAADNWFHGLGITFGPGWDVSSLTVTSEATSASTGTPAVWGYFPNSITGIATGMSYPPGFYFETGSGNSTGSYDGNPGDNFGDDCATGSCVWTFCFTIEVSPTATAGTSCSLAVTPTGDGQSGSWTSGAGSCDDPPTTISTAVVGGTVLEASATGTNVSCAGSCDGTATASAINGTTPYTYKWSTNPAQTTAEATHLCAGTYTCTVTDAASHTATASYTVTQGAQMTATIPDTTEITCGNTGYLPVYPVSGTAPYTYSWSNNQTGATDNNIPAGNYSVTVTDAGNCTVLTSGTLTLTVGTNTVALQAPVIVNDSCTGLADGSIIANVSGGSTPYTYSWSNTQTGDTAINLGVGSYSLTVTDAADCKATGTYNITQPAQLVINAPTIQNVACFDSLTGSITASVSGGTPGYAYNWSNNETGIADTALGPGNYTLIVTDTNGCSATQSYTITQPTQLTINPATIQNIGCAGGNTGSISANVIQGSPAYTYNWLQQTGGQTYTGQTISNLSFGTYLLTVTDAHGCTDTASYAIDTIPLLVTIDSVDNVSCFGGNNGAAKVSVTSGTPPYNYSWNYGTAITDSIISNLSQGPVEVVVTDANNCTVQSFMNITEPAPVAIQLVSDSSVSCNGGSNGSITIAASGGTPGYTYAWSNNETGVKDTGLVVGAYGVLVTDTNGCTAAQTFNIAQPTALSINAPGIQNIGCSGGNTGSITANVTQGTPPYSYNWLGQPNNQVYSGQTISNLPTGSYFLAVTDNNGCIDTTTYAITAIPVLTFTVSTTNVSCFEGNNGSAQASVTSGTPPFQYSWDNAAYISDSIDNNLNAGFLKVNVTDANNCLADTTVNISQPTPIVISLVSQDNVLCNGGNNGRLVVAATGGTPAYSFNWSNQFVGSDNTNLTAGNYIVIVLDNNDCADTAQYVITQPTPVVVNPTAINVLCNGGADGSIDANPSGGVPLYSFIWSNGETTRVANNLAKGAYDCTVADANGCTVIATDTVGQPAPMVITDSTTRVKCYGQHNGTAIVWVTGDTPPYFYNATQDNVNFISSTNGIILGLDTGVYTLQVSDSNGCLAETYINVLPAIPDEFYPPVIDSTLCYGPDYNDGSVLISDSTIQNGPYQYGIDEGILQDTGYFQNLAAGPHMVTVVNANGCIDSIPVFVPQPLPIEAIVTPDSLTLPLGGSQAVLVTTLNATNPAFSWANTLGFSCTDCPNPVVSSYAPGTYVVTVSMQNGTATCYGSTTLYVDVLSHTKAYIPNAFTPNGDGNNDVFQVYGEDIKTLSMRVFNRWGELVYSTTNSLAGWDGTYKGVMQMPCVFTYETVITYLDDSQENRNGSITLIR